MKQVSGAAATSALEREHRSIATVIHTVSVIADHVEQGRQIDVPLLKEVIFFLRVFADQCQTAKEDDLLFPALAQKCISPEECPIESLKDEHRQAGSLTLQLLDAVDAYAAGRAFARESLARTLRRLAQLYREHLWTENHVVLPLAEKVLSPEERERLSSAFERVEAKIGTDEVASRIGERAKRCSCYVGEVLN